MQKFHTICPIRKEGTLLLTEDFQSKKKIWDSLLLWEYGTNKRGGGSLRPFVLEFASACWLGWGGGAFRQSATEASSCPIQSISNRPTDAERKWCVGKKNLLLFLDELGRRRGITELAYVMWRTREECRMCWKTGIFKVLTQGVEEPRNHNDVARSPHSSSLISAD